MRSWWLNFGSNINISPHSIRTQLHFTTSVKKHSHAQKFINVDLFSVTCLLQVKEVFPDKKKKMTGVQTSGCNSHGIFNSNALLSYPKVLFQMPQQTIPSIN